MSFLSHSAWLIVGFGMCTPSACYMCLAPAGMSTWLESVGHPESPTLMLAVYVHFDQLLTALRLLPLPQVRTRRCLLLEIKQLLHMPPD